MRRTHIDVTGKDWGVWQNEDGSWPMESIQRSILLDIRKELQKLNSLLHCHNFMDIPFKLDRIRKNTTKPRPKKKAIKRKVKR